MNKEDFSKEKIALIAKRIKELRIEKGYTNYEQFAFDNNISRTQYGRYEKGQDLRMSSFLWILKALDVTPCQFFKSLE